MQTVIQIIPFKFFFSRIKFKLIAITKLLYSMLIIKYSYKNCYSKPSCKFRIRIEKKIWLTRLKLYTDLLIK